MPRLSPLVRNFSFRQFITTLIVGGYFVAYFISPGDETMKGALIAAFAGAWGYWLGSSQGAHENREALNRHQDKLLGVTHPQTDPPP